MEAKAFVDKYCLETGESLKSACSNIVATFLDGNEQQQHDAFLQSFAKDSLKKLSQDHGKLTNWILDAKSFCNSVDMAAGSDIMSVIGQPAHAIIASVCEKRTFK